MEIVLEFEDKKQGFFERNRQVFEMAIILAIVFLIIIFVSLFLPKTKPELIPVEEYEQQYNI